jgi:hypothetical protein
VATVAARVGSATATGAGLMGYHISKNAQARSRGYVAGRVRRRAHGPGQWIELDEAEAEALAFSPRESVVIEQFNGPPVVGEVDFTDHGVLFVRPLSDLIGTTGEEVRVRRKHGEVAPW